MQEQYKYSLERGSKKHICPQCNKKRMVRYVDNTTGKYLPSEFGRCDRADKCGYHCNPYEAGYAKEVWKQEQGLQGKQHYRPKIKPVGKPKPQAPVFIPFEVLRATRESYGLNAFVQNLLLNLPYRFPAQDVGKVISQYHIGTISKGRMKGAVTFPFIDSDWNIRAIQVKTFDKSNHTIATSFIHAILKEQGKALPEWISAYSEQEKKVSCLFGAHLLNKYPNNPIALVEAPKTAIYGTLYFGFPENTSNFLWLAVYNLSSLTLDKCQVLKGRHVYLFPDSSQSGNAYKEWSRKAEDFNRKVPRAKFMVSRFLEENATQADKEKGIDLADYLIQLDWRDFRRDRVKSVESAESEAPTKPFFCHESYKSKLHWENGLLMAEGYPAEWDLTASYLSEETKLYLKEMLAIP